MIEQPSLDTLAEFAPHALGQGFSYSTVPPEWENVGPDGESGDGWERRLKRWELQSAAREILPDWRVSQCFRHRLPGDQLGVRVHRRDRDSSTYYNGLKVCGSVWVCPVCSARISEKKRQELKASIELWKKRGGGVQLLTLTVPHVWGVEAFGLLDRLLDAYRAYGKGSKTAWTLAVPGYAGAVRALEVTHGKNGWHPHLHVLVFTDTRLSLVQVAMLGDILFARWAKVVEKVGLGEAKRAAFDFQEEREAAKYVGKWGAAEELTKAHLKEGRRGGRTPWALLVDYMQGDTQAGALFREFAEGFKGRSQLQWSRGLRDEIGLSEEKTDEELARDDQANDPVVALIASLDWSIIKRRNLRGQVLELLRQSDWSAVELLLDGYRDRQAAD